MDRIDEIALEAARKIHVWQPERDPSNETGARIQGIIKDALLRFRGSGTGTVASPSVSLSEKEGSPFNESQKYHESFTQNPSASPETAVQEKEWIGNINWDKSAVEIKEGPAGRHIAYITSDKEASNVILFHNLAIRDLQKPASVVHPDTKRRIREAMNLIHPPDNSEGNHEKGMMILAELEGHPVASVKVKPITLSAAISDTQEKA